MFQFFNNLFQQFTGNFLSKNNIFKLYGYFILSILTKWYMLVMMAGVLAAYWVLYGLMHVQLDNGHYLMESVCNHVSYYLNMSVAIAKQCTPKIIHLFGPSGFLDCLDSTSGYSDASSAVCNAMRPGKE